MAKPRVFVSSTYYDLKHIRESLEAFVESLGYEAVLFESGDIPFHHDIPLDESCYSEIQGCHMLVLIIGGRYGNPSSDSKLPEEDEMEKVYAAYNSVTRKEYETAARRDIPVFIFVEKNVYSEYRTYKENRDNPSIKYAYVDSINVFRLLDDILAQKRNNYLKEFDKFDDIASWLRDQWAGIFADFLSRKSTETSLKDLSAQVSDLRQVSSVLKEYSESIIRKIQPTESKKIILEQEKKLRDAKIRRFGQEHLVVGFLLLAPTKGFAKKKITASSIFEALEGSQSFEDFLVKAGIEKRMIKSLVKKLGQTGPRLYAQLVKEYLHI